MCYIQNFGEILGNWSISIKQILFYLIFKSWIFIIVVKITYLYIFELLYSIICLNELILKYTFEIFTIQKNQLYQFSIFSNFILNPEKPSTTTLLIFFLERQCKSLNKISFPKFLFSRSVSIKLTSNLSTRQCTSKSPTRNGGQDRASHRGL